jgi:RNA polymerase sigma factor (TIGR02999 family)
MHDESSSTTELLRRWRLGEAGAEDQLFARLNADLRRLARCIMRGEHGREALQATELVDQIYIRLVAAKDRDWQNRQHFFAVAARAMRHHLIDLARARPDNEIVTLNHLQAVLPAGTEKLEFAVAVNSLLDRLAAEHPDWCRLVELKYFLGLTDEEAAAVLDIKLRTLQRMWCDARRWLYERLEPRQDEQTGK